MADATPARFVADISRVQDGARPDAVALWFEGRETTYAELDRLASRCANALIDAGVKPGDRVGVLAKGNDDFFVLWLGCAKARACLTPVNWRLAPPEIAFILKDAGAQVLVCGADYADVVDTMLGEVELHRLVQFEPGHARWPAFRDWIGAHPDRDPKLPALEDDDVIQLYTSGTTGLPKGVQLTNGNYAALFECAIAADWGRYDPGDVVMDVAPLFHVAGANTGVLALLQGCRLVVMREVEPRALLETLQGQRVNHVFLVPALINMLLQFPGAGEADFSSLKRIFYGASPIAEDVLIRAAALFGCTFTQLYGLTETIGGGAYLPPLDHDPARGKLRACGKPWPGFEMRVVKPGGEIAAPFEVGELQIRSRGVMKGYWNRPDATREAIDAEGWFKSGDAGYVDGDGYFYIHDRVKDMIVTGGENVYPAEVENALFGHPDVADAAVIGVPDERWGEAVKAVVVLKPGAVADPGAIIAHCRERIAGYKTPKSVDFVAVLPRNPSGKVLRRELRAPYWEGKGRMVG
ncbi:acyl-CoA synthetase [Caulobacter sp. CCUG 60055]|nr:long-chain-fatty-acid--CoA ligase [Caulobacter sp. CCUG 60055]MCI3180635.1 acyl-CoA synthetase [Caulobacter sp. CCUG 60055]